MPTNERGVRIFSRVPPVGVHPRVLLSPEDLPGWREHVITTYRGKAFFAKRFVSKRIDTTVEPAGRTSREDWQRYPLGAAVPVVSAADAEGSVLGLDGRKDEWTFQLGKDGRSHMRLERGGTGWVLE